MRTFMMIFVTAFLAGLLSIGIFLTMEEHRMDPNVGGVTC